MDLRSLLEKQVKEIPHKTFIYFEDPEGKSQEISYSDFDLKVNRLANDLLQLGVKKSTVVSILIPNCPEWLCIFFACAKIGAIAGPINTGFKGEEIKYQLNHSGAAVLVTNAYFLEIISEVRKDCNHLQHIVVIDQEQSSPEVLSFSCLIRGSSSSPPPVVFDKDDILCIMYTSGTSTGIPKGVLIPNLKYVAAGEGYTRASRVTSEDRIIFASPLFHGNALLCGVMMGLTPGGSIVFPERFSASRFWSQVNRYQATVFVTLGAIVRILLNLPPSEEEAQHPLRLILAMTETQAGTTTPVDGSYKLGSVGYPMSHIEMKIFNEEGKEVPPNTQGEIVFRHRDIMKGYYKNPEAMAESIRDGWFYTGDIGYRDEDGCFYFVDRKKDIVRRSGENISAREVEEVLNNHPKILESAVVGVPDNIRGEEVKAYLVVNNGAEPPLPEEIIEYCKERLADFKVPQYIEFRESFPKTATGRIQKIIILKEEAKKTVERL
ncbi:MAG: AMP-binding protein [Deltaproteobacteria bacterium]|nr:AMP-binding protein [Deltaproteobacteria bacterium]